MQKEKESGNLNITTTGLTLQIIVPRRIERALILFLVAVFSIITLFLYLLGITETNADTENPSFFLIMKLIFYGIGSILFTAMIYETIKREVIVVNRYSLILKNSFLNVTLNERFYKLKHITDIRFTHTPANKRKNTEKYNDRFHRWHTYSPNNTKISPTIQFKYKGEIVLFATGLTYVEAQIIIDLVAKKIQQLNQV